MCIHLIAQSIGDKDGAIKRVFEQVRSRCERNAGLLFTIALFGRKEAGANETRRCFQQAT